MLRLGDVDAMSKRIWRCREPGCATTTVSETHDLPRRGAVLTVRSVRWATDALTHDETTVALARPLGTIGIPAGTD